MFSILFMLLKITFLSVHWMPRKRYINYVLLLCVNMYSRPLQMPLSLKSDFMQTIKMLID